MKVGDLVAYAWNAKERPEEVELAVVVAPHPYMPNYFTEEYVQIYLFNSPEISPPLRVPGWKLDVVSEAR